MTPDLFRANPMKVQRLRELLADPIMEEALIVVKDGYPVSDANVDMEAIASVRILSQFVGYSNAINRLLELGTYLEEPVVPLTETWGVPDEPETPQEPKP